MTRSTIGLPVVYKETLEALGLKKRGSIAYQKVSPASAGMIAKVKELVRLQVVEQPKTKAQEKDARRFSPGFQVVGSRI